MRPRRTLIPLAALLLGTPSAQAADPSAPTRLAFTPLVEGPLPPARAELLERLLLDELDGYDSFRVVDAAGNALDQRLLALEAQRATELKNEGVDLLLRFQYAPAIKKLEAAISVFEARLVALPDYELLHDALLAKAEALYHSGEKSAARAAVKNLLALSPRTRPTAKTHEKAFVALYDKAKGELEAVGRIQVGCEIPGCTIQIDGQKLGPAPLYATRILPGRHYIVATWSNAVQVAIVQVPPGGEAKAQIRREGPAEEARRELRAALERKGGLAEVQVIGQRIAALAQAQQVLVAAVRTDPEGQDYLLVGLHEDDGSPTKIVRLPLPASVDDATLATDVRRLGAALFVEQKRGELDLAPDGAARSAPGIAALLYGGGGDIPRFIVGEVPPEEGVLPSEKLKVEPEAEPSPLETWWFWTIVGVVAASAAVGTVVLVSGGDPTTTRFEVRLP